MIVVIMLASLMASALAAPSVKSHGNQMAAGSVTSEATVATPTPKTTTEPAHGVPALEVRYAVVESKLNLMIGVMADIVKLVPLASDLNAHIAKLSEDLSTLNTYVIANDSKGLNAYVKDTVHPDMLNASKAITADTKQFKDWGVTKDTLKQLKNDTKQLRDDYNTGAHVSAAAKKDNSAETQAYLNKAGIQVHGKAAPNLAEQGKTHGPKANETEESTEGST